MHTQKLKPVAEKLVQMVAEILGPHSACAMALKDADRRRAAGETVEFFQSGSDILVRGQPANQPTK